MLQRTLMGNIKHMVILPSVHVDITYLKCVDNNLILVNICHKFSVETPFSI